MPSLREPEGSEDADGPRADDDHFSGIHEGR